MHFFQGCREYFQNISFPLLQMEIRPHAYYNELQQSHGRCTFLKPLSGFENCDDGLRINSKQA